MKNNFNFDDLSAEDVYALLMTFSSKIDFRNPFHIIEYANAIKANVRELASFKNSITEVEKLFTRARKNIAPRTVYPNISDLWYPPDNKVTIGRANYPGRPVYYCCNHPMTSIYELRLKIGDWFTLLEVDIQKPDLDILVMGIDPILFKIDTSSFTEKDFGVNKFLETKFKEPIKSEESYLYYQTAEFVRAFASKNDGVAYPSVGSNLREPLRT